MHSTCILPSRVGSGRWDGRRPRCSFHRL